MIIKEGIHINGIYQHYKGDYYRVHNVAIHHEEGLFKAVVIYSKCDINGIHISLRYEVNGEEEIIIQPFYRLLIEFIENVECDGECGMILKPRFKFIKEL